MAAGVGSLGCDAADSCSADVILYSAVISACEKSQQWQQALGLFALMQQTDVLPDVMSYNATISAVGNGQQWQQASISWR